MVSFNGTRGAPNSRYVDRTIYAVIQGPACAATDEEKEVREAVMNAIAPLGRVLTLRRFLEGIIWGARPRWDLV